MRASYTTWKHNINRVNWAFHSLQPNTYFLSGLQVV